MAKIPFVGPSYSLSSLSVDCQKTVNMYPSLDETGEGKTQTYLIGTPGLKEFLIPNNNTEEIQIRAMFVDSKDDFYLVSGDKFIRVDYDIENNIYNQVILGVLQTTTGPVSIAENGFQIGLVDGDNYYLYIYLDKTFSSYEPDGWLGSDTINYFGSYFVFVKRDSQQYYISDNYNGAIIDPLNFASAEGSPDNIVAALNVRQNLWMFGTKTIEIFYNEGLADFPLSKMDITIQNGCVAPFSVSILNNNPVWLGRDETGTGFVFTADGYNPIKISNFAVETAIQSYDNIEDAVSYSYSQNGHTFYILNFPSAGTTWCYDLTTKMWHERQSLNTKTGAMERHRTQLHVLWRNKHLVSDFEKNIVYELDLDTYTDNGEPIKRIRRSPHMIGANLENLTFYDFKLDMDLGDSYVLKNNNLNTQGNIYLRYSNNGGKTWSDYLQADLGKPGDYTKRVIWRRLGSSRDRVWEVTTSDPIKIVILSAYSNTIPGRF